MAYAVCFQGTNDRRHLSTSSVLPRFNDLPVCHTDSDCLSPVTADCRASGQQFQFKHKRPRKTQRGGRQCCSGTRVGGEFIGATQHSQSAHIPSHYPVGRSVAVRSSGYCVCLSVCLCRCPPHLTRHDTELFISRSRHSVVHCPSTVAPLAQLRRRTQLKSIRTARLRSSTYLRHPLDINHSISHIKYKRHTQFKPINR